MRATRIKGVLRASFSKLGLFGGTLRFLHLTVEFCLLRIDIGGTHGPDLGGNFLVLRGRRLLAMAASPDREITEHEKTKRNANALQSRHRDSAFWRLVLLADTRRCRRRRILRTGRSFRISGHGSLPDVEFLFSDLQIDAIENLGYEVQAIGPEFELD